MGSKKVILGHYSSGSTELSREKEAKTFALDAMGPISEVQLDKNAACEYEY